MNSHCETRGGKLRQYSGNTMIREHQENAFHAKHLQVSFMSICKSIEYIFTEEQRSSVSTDKLCYLIQEIKSENSETLG